MPIRFALRHGAFLAACLLGASWALPADHFLTIGGGEAPSHNQVSLEKNVIYLQHVLDDIGVGQSSHDIFFSGGPESGRDLQAHAAAPIPRVNLLLARVLNNNEDAVELEYRKEEIPAVRGASNRKTLNDWFENVGAKLADDDRLIIYFTGHGGSGKPLRNTTMTLWHENAMPMKEFLGLLDKLPPKVSVVLVMVQCHSGGFADVIFKNGDFAGAPSDRNRCGFFATVPERPAAGCTADINEENYHEYSTYFWEAISGKSRLGAVIKKPDYNGDGKVSFAEAHAYVKLTSGTIDIPVSTSDNFLRAYSRAPGVATGAAMNGGQPTTRPMRPRRREGVNPDAGGDTPATRPARAPDAGPSTQPVRKLVSVDSPYYDLAEAADPARKAVLEGLSEQLHLTGPERARAARDLANQLQRQKDDLGGQKRTATNAFNFARQKIAGTLRDRWPELSTPFHPRQAEILQKEGDAVIKAIEGHEAYKQMETQSELLDKLDVRETEADRTWVKTQRFLRTLEDVALAVNLPKVASPELVERYRRLTAAEYGYIDPH